MKINKVFEVAIAVNDIRAATDKFRAVLGVDPVPEIKEERMVTPGVENVSFPVGRMTVSLLGSRTPDTPVARFLRTRGEGVYLIGLDVDDIEETMKEAGEPGLRWLNSEPIKYGYGRLSFADPGTTHGVLITFSQHDEGYFDRVLRGE